MRPSNVSIFLGSLVLCVLAGSGCGFTHRYRLEGRDLDPAPLARSQQTRVAVVFSPAEIPLTQETGTDGHTFVFENLEVFYERAFRSALSGRVAAVDFHTAPPPGYDAYVFPSLRLETSGAFVHDCTATYGLRVQDVRGTTLATQEARGQHSFAAIASADEACTVAMLQAYAQVTLTVLAAIDRIAPAAAAPAVIATAGGEAVIAAEPAQAPPTADAAPTTGCAAGRVATELSGGRCCWPGQSWNDAAGRCEGPPTCPGGMASEGDACVPAS